MEPTPWSLPANSNSDGRSEHTKRKRAIAFFSRRRHCSSLTNEDITSDDGEDINDGIDAADEPQPEEVYHSRRYREILDVSRQTGHLPRNFDSQAPDAPPRELEEAAHATQEVPHQHTFLGVPVEIRAIIYEQLFANQTLEIMHWLPFRACLTWKSMGLATITAVCKQVRAESLPIMRSHCTIIMSETARLFPKLQNREGLFDPRLLKKIECDYITLQGRYPFDDFSSYINTFPNLEVLTVKCFRTDIFDWRRDRKTARALTNSAGARKILLGGVLNRNSRISEAVKFVENGLARAEKDGTKWKARVLLKMKVYAMIEPRRSNAQVLGMIVVDVEEKKMDLMVEEVTYPVELFKWRVQE